MPVHIKSLDPSRPWPRSLNKPSELMNPELVLPQMATELKVSRPSKINKWAQIVPRSSQETGHTYFLLLHHALEVWLHKKRLPNGQQQGYVTLVSRSARWRCCHWNPGTLNDTGSKMYVFFLPSKCSLRVHACSLFPKKCKTNLNIKNVSQSDTLDVICWWWKTAQ